MKLVLYFLISSCLTLVLLLTFIYLMTVVDPGLLELSDKAIMFRESEEKIELEELLYPSEILKSDDNVAYGLEKVDYDAIEVHDKLSNLSSYRISDVPKIISVQKTNMQNYKTIINSAKKENQIHRMTTAKSKLAKGFRRSIREKPNLRNSKLMSLLLNIKLINGQPRVEIKILDDKNEDKIDANQIFVGKMKTTNISDLVQNETLLVQFVGNLTNLNEPKENIPTNSISNEKDESVFEIENSNKTSKDHVLDLPDHSKTSTSVTTKSDNFTEIKEKYEINVTSALPTQLNNLNVSKIKTIKT